jgi:hypothetical protein
MEKNLPPRVFACRTACPPRADRRRLVGGLLAGAIALPAALAGCAEGSYAPDNRAPHMKHGNIEAPGTRAEDNQGNAGND